MNLFSATGEAVKNGGHIHISFENIYVDNKIKSVKLFLRVNMLF